jgi:hypothetical protein
MWQRPLVVEDAPEIAAIDPRAASAFNEVVGFICWRPAQALADIHAARYRSILRKVVRHFGCGDFQGIAVRTGLTSSVACARLEPSKGA